MRGMKVQKLCVAALIRMLYIAHAPCAIYDLRHCVPLADTRIAPVPPHFAIRSICRSIFLKPEFT